MIALFCLGFLHDFVILNGMSTNIRVRFAPSPTGNLHIGAARTTLFNWLFAKKHGGAFIFRIEDTDTERSKKEYEDNMAAGLKWLGLNWDEFYRQSDRMDVYSKYIQKMLDEGTAFWCYHTQEELEAENKRQMDAKEAPCHVCEYKNENQNAKIQMPHKGIIRFKNNVEPGRKIIVNDLIRGELEFDAAGLGDFSIAKNVAEPLYHIAVVVDDYDMNITHIIRADEHIANTPKHILLQEAFGFPRPEYAHVPLVLAPDHSKLSKRHGATSVDEYRKKGYLPEAIINYLALLGFTPPDGREFMTPDELVSVFDLNKVHKSGAIFDIKKLDWMNGEYIKKKTDKELAPLIAPFLKQYFNISPVTKDIVRLLPLLRDRMAKFSDVERFGYLFTDPKYDAELLIWKDAPYVQIRSALEVVREAVKKAGVINTNALRKQLDDFGKNLGNRGIVYWPFRVALTGAETSPDPVDIARALGQKTVLKRIEKAISLLTTEK